MGVGRGAGVVLVCWEGNAVELESMKGLIFVLIIFLSQVRKHLRNVEGGGAPFTRGGFNQCVFFFLFLARFRWEEAERIFRVFACVSAVDGQDWPRCSVQTLRSRPSRSIVAAHAE